jgi:hypothetical protein
LLPFPLREREDANSESTLFSANALERENVLADFVCVESSTTSPGASALARGKLPQEILL